MTPWDALQAGATFTQQFAGGTDLQVVGLSLLLLIATVVVVPRARVLSAWIFVFVATLAAGAEVGNTLHSYITAIPGLPQPNLTGPDDAGTSTYAVSIMAHFVLYCIFAFSALVLTAKLRPLHLLLLGAYLAVLSFEGLTTITLHAGPEGTAQYEWMLGDMFVFIFTTGALLVGLMSLEPIEHWCAHHIFGATPPGRYGPGFMRRCNICTPIRPRPTVVFQPYTPQAPGGAGKRPAPPHAATAPQQSSTRVVTPPERQIVAEWASAAFATIPVRARGRAFDALLEALGNEYEQALLEQMRSPIGNGFGWMRKALSLTPRDKRKGLARALAGLLHPDQGGTDESFVAWQDATRRFAA